MFFCAHPHSQRAYPATGTRRSAAYSVFVYENTFLKIGFIRKVFFILSNKQVFFCAQKNQNAGGLRTPPGAPTDAFGTGNEGAGASNAVSARAVAARRAPPWNGRQGCGGLLRGKRGRRNAPFSSLTLACPRPWRDAINLRPVARVSSYGVLSICGV